MNPIAPLSTKLFDGAEQGDPFEFGDRARGAT